MSLAGLVDPPDQAGELMKRGHGKWRPWRQRYFVLKARLKWGRSGMMQRAGRCLNGERPCTAAQRGIQPNSLLPF